MTRPIESAASWYHRIVLRRSHAFLWVVLAGCNYDANGQGTESTPSPVSTTGSSSDSTTGATVDPPATGSGSLDGTSTAASTGTDCPPGSAGCPCDEGACTDDLLCISDECVAPVCGDQRVQGDEDCDDANAVPFDGCENDCTFSAGVRTISLGEHHACAAFHTGLIKCWGEFNDGRLGYPGLRDDVGDDETPATLGWVELSEPVAQLSLGNNHTCARHTDGTVRCWGVGVGGRLGHADETSIGDNEAPGSLDPIDLGRGAVQISAGGGHTCAVLDDAQVRCWGLNNHGQLGMGMGMNVGDDESPGSVPSVNLGEDAIMVAAGLEHSCALLSTGQVRCWGRNQTGQLGRGDTDNLGVDQDPAEEPPVILPEPADLIVCGRNHCCVRLVTGNMMCWGEGGSGRLGYGDTDDYGDDETLAEILPVTPPSPIVQLAARGLHTCALLEDESLRCWGEADRGRLGLGDNVDQLEFPMTPIDTGLTGTATGIAAGDSFTCAHFDNGQVKCWGDNDHGQLGYGDALTENLGDDEPLDTVDAVPIE